MPGIADTFTYDDIELGIGSRRHIEISMEMDPTNRQVKFHRIQVSVEAVIAVDIEASVEEIKARLTKPGGRLYIENCGFGESLDIGGQSGQQDVKAGPHPKLIRFEPMAATTESTAIEVTWQCETCIFFPKGEGEIGSILSFVYGATYSIDAGGWTTRTVSGQLEVAMQRDGDRFIAHNADHYRENIKVIKPEGFARTQHYDLSQCKSILNFSIVDTQIKTRQPYPPGVVEIACNHRVSRSRSQLATTRNSINFRCEVAANQPTAYAWFVFQSIVGKRLNHARANDVQILIDEIEADENIFGTEFSASVSYRGLGDLGSWLYNSGLFQPVQLSWDAWETSMSDIKNARGIAQLRANADDDDRLVNLEYPQTPVIEDASTPLFNHLTPNQSPLCNALPEPDKSWAHFEGEFDIDQSAIETDHWIPLGPQALEDGVLNLNELGGAGRRVGRAEVPSLLSSNSGYPTRLTFRGQAIRVGYEIPLPRLAINGVKTSLIDKQFKTKFLGIFYCQPVYAAKWALQYQIGDMPVGIKPGMNTDGTQYSSSKNSPGNQG